MSFPKTAYLQSSAWPGYFTNKGLIQAWTRIKSGRKEDFVRGRADAGVYRERNGIWMPGAALAKVLRGIELRPTL
jgi:hypothetical protein